MRIPRLYHPDALAVGSVVHLTDSAINHLRVLRLVEGEPVILFNGEGGEYTGCIENVQKRSTTVRLTAFDAQDIGSTLTIHLGQVISRGERMDFTIQKAVELGVSGITPLFSERCEVKLHGERLAKKMLHWHGIITHACEQSGRTRLPQLYSAQTLAQWSKQCQEQAKLTLDPTAQNSIANLMQQAGWAKATDIALLIGAEGGLTAEEIACAKQNGFTGLTLGPRILRTETAGLAAITALQCTLGDMR